MLKRAVPSSGYYEPSLAAVVLRACRGCGAPHPRAMYPPPQDLDACPSCGAPVASAGPPVVVPAVVTGLSPAAVVARLCLALGRFLRALSKRI